MASPPAWFRTPRTLVIGALSGALALGLVTGLIVPAPTPAQAAGVTAASTVESTAAAAPAAAPSKAKAPKPASKTRKARNVPERPRDTHTGKRIVYDKALMTVWLMDADNEVVARYPVVGRWDRPKAGTYHVMSKSPMSYNPESKVTFAHMVRFAPGLQTGYSIGFHAIPRYRDGKMMHSTKQLGLAIARGGCVRLSDQAADRVYRFLDKGDLVVVLPSP